MRRFFDNAALMALFSGLLTQISFTQINFILSWVCFVPLFIVLNKQSSTKQLLKTGILFGLIISTLSFFWMIPGAERFTGNSVLYGILVFLVSVIFMCLYFGLVILLFGFLKKHLKNIFSIALLAACVFTTLEALLMLASKHLPWFGFHSGMGLAGNLYTIQPAEYFGMHILSFTVVFLNCLAAGCIVNKKWVKLSIPAGLIIVYFAAGWLISTKYSFLKAKGIKVDILATNIAPEMRWDENTGNALAQKMIGLSNTAAADNPALALWSESAIPWTYRRDDDLVNEILKTSKKSNVTHILGINTDGVNGGVYNSAYSILPNGNVTGRYDKQVLLSFIEEPLGGIIFPFLSGGGFVIQKSKYNKPINTPYGKAGIIICNEATVSSLASSMANNGAQFILNLSNDGWFSNSYLVDLHFYNVRMRAVETRKDVAVNSNYGYSGLVKASGEIDTQHKSTSSFVDMVIIHPNNIKTLYTANSLLFIYLCLAGLAFLGIISYLRIAKK